ncbi:DUF2306 domain-containing protein [Caulobacter endophyticus]|uniref:DUF2306 domain-containing protein n=1 Tax=Caulobacter endophyticus TaxID=2172652 RepID=UPI00241010B2|nr:DUF2306 domain-containing protein [Caulobacter endophyticus]MDG2528348.1 DUF2306 domain-containing protein [Caulobacter endophyticus]
MPETNLSMHAAARGLRRRGVAGVLAATALAAAPFLAPRLGAHLPNLALVAAAPLKIQVHILAALTALAIGTMLMIGVKGTRLHRTLGWTWVAAMATTAVSSLFIREMNHGAMSWIHLLSGWTIVALPMAVYAARRHKVHLHRRFMTGLFVGGLLIAGGFTFLPGRLLWRVFFG